MFKADHSLLRLTVQSFSTYDRFYVKEKQEGFFTAALRDENIASTERSGAVSISHSA
jgi:hypothetical protein